MNRPRSHARAVAAFASAALVVLALAGCAQQYADGSGQGYISGDGAYTEIKPNARQTAITFTGTDESGASISSTSYLGKVYVVNFWYAACPPCRSEAPTLAQLSTTYSNVPFVGVNIFDSSDVAKIFETKFNISYPSILDAASNSVQLAFAGAVAPNAVPTTLVIDREGRVAARISGIIRDRSILSGMIDTVVAEAK
jgi:thiol-disulfide isomerase/thioredoxin